MNLAQSAIDKMALLSEANLQIVLAIINEMIQQEEDSTAQSSRESSRELKREAFRSIMEMRKNSPFPKDFDYDKAREEAVAEKYGSLN